MTTAIAIDGPAGAGKSTVARAVAKQLGYIYVDTGALYRTIGLYMLENEIPPEDGEKVTAALPRIRVKLTYQEGEQRVLLNRRDVTEEIRTDAVSMASSTVSALPAVRSFLLELQRDLAQRSNVVMDGRDIGTVVLPEAQVKIFLTASAEERAQRRYKENQAKGMSGSYEQVLAAIKSRDEQDMNRETAPLKQAQDAFYLDTTNNTREQSVERILALVRAKLSR